jgi:hypothetical protein
MRLRLLFFAVFIFFTSTGESQAIERMLVSGGDWRICGNIDKSDTLVFSRVAPETVAYSCQQDEFAQLLFYPGLKFRLMIWDHDVCFIHTPGNLEINEGSGEFRFYFDDGTSRDYILIYIDKKKLVLVDKNY